MQVRQAAMGHNANRPAKGGVVSIESGKELESLMGPTAEYYEAYGGGSGVQ